MKPRKRQIAPGDPSSAELSARPRNLRTAARMAASQARLTQLEAENAELRRAQADLTAERDGVLALLNQQRAVEPAAVQESERELKAIFELLPVGISILDAERRVVFANSALVDIMGLSNEGLQAGQHRRWLYLRPDGTLMPAEEYASAQAIRAQRAVFDVETGVVRTDGRVAWTAVSAAPVALSSWKVVLVVRDITAQREAQETLAASEQRFRALYAAAQRRERERELLDQVRIVLFHELDLAQVVRKVVEAIAGTFGYAQVSLYLLQGDTLWLQHQVGYTTVIPAIPITQGVSGRVVRSRQPCLVTDVHADADFVGAIAGIVSEVCVPLLDEDRVMGTLNIESTGDVILTQADLELMTALGEHVSLAITRARLYTQVRESEERFRALITDLHVGVLLQGPASEILLYNQQALDLLGLTESQLLGKTSLDADWDVIHEDGSPFPGPTHPVPRAIASRRPVNDVLMGVFRLNTQSRIWLLVNANPQLHPDGSVRQVICTFMDVTARKHAEDALRQSEHLLQESQIVANLGSYLLDITSGLWTSSEVLDTIFGIEKAYQRSVSGWVALIHPEDRQAVSDYFMHEVIEKRAYFDRTYRIIRQNDGALRWVHGLGRLEFDAESRPVVMYGTIQDITERKQAEQRAFELALERERIALLSAFVQNASHEFRTPLTIMQTNLYLLERLTDPLKRQQKRAQIEQQIVGITRLVDMLAEVVRLDSHAPFTFQPTDLNVLLSDVVVTLAQRVAASRLTLQLMAAPDLPLAPVDADRLRVALRELLDNALRFTPAGGRVALRSARVAGGVTIEVQDSGPGIPSEMQPYIFDRFYRQDISHSTPGFGLGLPIARLIVERHGGRLEMESQPGEGSLFRIVLPL
ncbi:PAS domain S-box protein [Candidatus Amarolinea dominans]|uniref:PAS domain S-box protein n=1 Tax=Candidatus Amarolinea dominans TaxID=3140696 RepID=UPI003135DDC4|nr:PAS domain S-box protein [Anaerolineae bacterium]